MQETQPQSFEIQVETCTQLWIPFIIKQVDDELKKIRNPKLMTVRQRALLERKGELQNEENFKEELVALPTGNFVT